MCEGLSTCSCLIKALVLEARSKHLIGSTRLGVHLILVLFVIFVVLFERSRLDHGRKAYSWDVATEVIVRIWLDHSSHI